MKSVAPYEAPKLERVCHLPGDAKYFKLRFLQLPVIRESALAKRIVAHRRRRLLARPRGGLTWTIIRRWRLQRLAIAVTRATAVVLLMLAPGCGTIDAKGEADALGADAADADRDSSPRDVPPGGGGDASADVHASVDAGGGEVGGDAGGAAPDAGPACSWTCMSVCYCGALPCCRSLTSSDCCSS